jgi:SAM-dependent methyltransferase
MDRKILADLREAYDRQASGRDAGTMQEWKRKERDDFLSLLEKEKVRTLLEIGSGPGRDGLFFQENGLKVTCIDISPGNIELCRRKGLTAYVMDAGNMFFADSSFDAVFALNSLLHLAKTELPGVLRSITAVLKPAGLFYMGVYGGNEFEGIREHDRTTPPRFFSFYEDEHLKQVVSGVFEIVSFKTISVWRDDVYHFQSMVLRKMAEDVLSR